MTTRPLNRDSIRWVLGNENVPQKTIEKFLEWVGKNRSVWKYFEMFTLQAIGMRKRYGAKAIAERVRWEVDYRNQWTDRKVKFKVNNNYLAYMARLFCYKHVNYEGYFKTRKVRGLRDGQGTGQSRIVD